MDLPHNYLFMLYRSHFYAQNPVLVAVLDE